MFSWSLVCTRTQPSVRRDQRMRSAVGLCVLGLLFLHSSVFGQDQVETGEPGVQVFCDDPSVERAVHGALHRFNQRLTIGHKLALFQIRSARKSENGSETVYSLEFTSRRSNCPAGSSQPWTDCEYLPTGPQVPLSCNATVHLTETESDTRQVDCLFDNFIVPEKAACLGCPVDIDENSEDLKVPVSASISKYNSISDSTHLFSLHEVGKATRQVVAGFRFNVRFDMRKTTCAKAEHKDLNELCVADVDNVEFVNCNSTVDVAPWRLELPSVQMECEQGALPPTTFSRRRPPGWSPLRNFLYRAPTTTSPPPSSPPAQSPSKPAAKEESSEEDIAASKTSASPDEQTHCPSKPWKPFQPVDAAAAAPSEAPTGAGSPQPPVEGAFSDTDLLA